MKGSKLFCVVFLAVSLKMANALPLDNPEQSDVEPGQVPVNTTEASSVLEPNLNLNLNRPEVPTDEGNITRRPETSENKPKEEEEEIDGSDKATHESPNDDGGDNKGTPPETKDSSDTPTNTTSEADPGSDQDDGVTNVTSDLVTSVSPIPTSGEEEVTSSSTTLNPADSPANDEPSNDGEAQPDPKPENEETVADEKDQEAQPSVAPGPDHERHFDGWSFFGGILLTVSMLLIGFVLTKYYRVKQGEGRIYNRVGSLTSRESISMHNLMPRN